MPPERSPEPLLVTRDLKRHYPRGSQIVKALDGVSIDIERGEFVAVVGASGSGKSTLLNLFAGLDTPTSGSIEVGGLALCSLGRRELASYRARRVAMVFQSFNLIGHYSALKNVELALYFGGFPPRDRTRRARSALESLGLGERLDHLPGDLSGGEQQRVSIARALVKEPDILLADEPTGNLDFESTRQIADLLSRLNGGGLTVVLVTHDLELARRCAGRVLRMHYGRMAGDADPAPRAESDT